jgi:MFS family permease
MSLLVWPGLVAPVVAPLAGGVITTYAGWQWLFLVNVPLGVIAFAVAWRLIGSLQSEAPGPLDWPGVILMCGGLAGATYAAFLLSEPSVSLVPVVACGAVSAVVLAAAVRHLLRTNYPVVNLRTLRVPTFAAAVGSGSLFWTTIIAVPFLLTLLFQNLFGWSPVKSGALVMFVFIGNIGIKPTTTPLLRRFGFRTVLIAATAGAAVTMVMFGFLTVATPLVLIAAVAILNGVGRSVSLTGYSTIGFADVPPEQMPDANALQATAQQLSVGLGVTVGAIALRAGEPLARALPGSFHQADAYTIAFLLIAAVALMATVGAIRMHPDAGAAVTRRPAPDAGESGETEGKDVARV